MAHIPLFQVGARLTTAPPSGSERSWEVPGASPDPSLAEPALQDRLGKVSWHAVEGDRFPDQDGQRVSLFMF